MLPFSPRQAEVVELTEKQYTRREIAEMLGIGATTVKYHLQRAANKDPAYAQVWRADNIARTRRANLEVI